MRKVLKRLLLYSPQLITERNWKVGCVHHAKRFNLSDLLRNLRNGIQDKSIPLCCIINFVVDEFLTGRVQASIRGLLVKPHYYRQNLGTAYTPCFVHLKGLTRKR